MMQIVLRHHRNCWDMNGFCCLRIQRGFLKNRMRVVRSTVLSQLYANEQCHSVSFNQYNVTNVRDIHNIVAPAHK
jgi:hypothetical protein